MCQKAEKGYDIVKKKNEMLVPLARSESAASVWCHEWISESTVISESNVSNIRSSVPTPQSANVSFQSREHHIERMEKALYVWIEDQTEKNALEWTGVREKSLQIYKAPVQPWLMEIEAKGFEAKQVFNAEEKGLFWKRMPFRTFPSKGAVTP